MSGQPVVHQLRLLQCASVITSKAPVYNAINYDWNTCNQRNIIYTVVGVCHIRIGEIISPPS